jgi:hypothetical protein
VATVSDGLAQVQSTSIVTVTAAPAPAQKPSQPGAGASNTATASAYGADFTLTFPHACVRAGSRVTVTMLAKKRTGARGRVLSKVVKVAFAMAGKTVKLVRSSPFRALLTMPRGWHSGSTVKIRATAYVLVHGAGARTTSITVPFIVC